ncbi:hypothetical protein M426DRAFT_70254 [Hypoxylon sp. CI-4A]|nr:hypothetical protein M426DRAFT_70254 [Hypoxylon sp. CI-4A]
MVTLTLAGLEALLAEIGVDGPKPIHAESDILRKPIDIYRNYLAAAASDALSCDGGLAYEAIQSQSANLKDNSDLTLVLPKLKWRSEKPKDLAREAFIKFSPTPLFQLPLPDGVHLRFIFSTLTLPRLILPYIDDRMSQYGREGLLDSHPKSPAAKITKKVVIEFSSPNLATEFNSSHLRSTILGAQIANLYECMGWDVLRTNYLGDWGKEIGLVGVGWDKFGSEEMFRQDPMSHLYDIYEKSNAQFKREKEASRKARDEGHNTAEIESQGLFAERDGYCRRMEDGEQETIAFWKRMRTSAIDYYSKAYKRLNVMFDEFSGESQVSSESIVEVESILKAGGIYEKSEDSWIIDYSKHGPKSLGVSVLRGRTGSTSYLLRDIAAVLDRDKKHSFDKMIYVVAADQDVHFQKVFQALRYMDRGNLADRLEHVSFGKAQGVSNLLGEVHLLNDILDQSTKDALNVLEQDENHPEERKTLATAEALGMTSLVAQLCGQSKRSAGYTLGPKTLVSFEGDTGPKLQSCYAKLQAKINESSPDDIVLNKIDYACLQEDPWTEVIRLLAQYPDAVESAYKSHEPSTLLTYLFRLCEELENCLSDKDIEAASSEEPPQAILAQAVLYQYARQVLSNGLGILGIVPMTSMHR